MSTATYGIDVSHHQKSSSLPWDTQFRGKVDFVYARATYGKDLKDNQCGDHVKNARKIGAKVGLYHFYRPYQGLEAQLDAFQSVAERVGYGVGDLIPALDIEHDPFPSPGHDVSTAWDLPTRELAERLKKLYGNVMIYITQREWGMLGRPKWVTDYPLWVAHYTAQAAPSSPGDVQPTIWQHRVAPFVHNGPGGYDKKNPALDQNRGLLPLPIIERHIDEDFDDLRDKGVLACFDYDVLDSSKQS